MKFCVAKISVLTPEERFKQCPKCKGDIVIEKYILTEKVRALRTEARLKAGQLVVLNSEN